MEAGATFGWEHYVGPHGIVLGMTGFGASAPAGRLMEHFGFTPESFVDAARKVLK